MPIPTGKLLQVLQKSGHVVGLPTTLLVDASGCEIALLKGPAEWALAGRAFAFIEAALGKPLARPSDGRERTAVRDTPISPDEGRAWRAPWPVHAASGLARARKPARRAVGEDLVDHEEAQGLKHHGGHLGRHVIGRKEREPAA